MWAAPHDDVAQTAKRISIVTDLYSETLVLKYSFFTATADQ